jgi:TBC1 domain family member 15
LEWGSKITKNVKTFRKTISEKFTAEEKEVEKKDDEEFEIIDNDEFENSSFSKKINLDDILDMDLSREGEKSISKETIANYFDKDGRVVDPKKFKRDVFYGGCDDDTRQIVWRFLLRYYPYDSTEDERKEIDIQKKKEYETLKFKWTSITKKEEENNFLFRDRKSRIEKDVCRTDRSHPLFKDDDSKYLVYLNDILMTYAVEYNVDLGYCQGMGDLVSPILSIVLDEAQSFWCFANLMEKMHVNFLVNSRGMDEQLKDLNALVKFLNPQFYQYLEEKESTNFYFCFRWILILFKREFSFDDIKRLWEAIWTDQMGAQFHIFLAYGLLNEHFETIMKNDYGFDEILKFCIDLSYNIDLNKFIENGEKSFLLYQSKEEKLKKK